MRTSALRAGALFALAAACGLAGCSGSSSGKPADAYALSVEFARLDTPAPYPVQCTVTVTNRGVPVTGAAARLSVSAARGTLGPISELGAGAYRFVLTPAGTGEHPLTIAFEDVSLHRTPLVLAAVHPGWGQPMAVEGLVNTEGYEDGVTITPDGEFLFVQYGAIYWSGIVLFDLPRAAGGCGGDRLNPDRCTHPWLDSVIGPIGPPERPGFFTGRISADGTTHLHNAASYTLGIDQTPNLAVTTMFYGFRRQPDGSFREPFYLAFDDEGDGIIGPYGLSFVPAGGNLMTVAFAMDDPADADMVDLDGDGNDDVQSLTDVYTLDIPLGFDTILGTYAATGVPGEPPVRSLPFNSILVDFGHTGIDGIAGTQGNPHLHAEGGVIRSVWTDDEYDGDADTGDLSVYVLESGAFPGGTWSKTVLPAPVNSPPPSDEVQPFFSGDGLFFARLGTGLTAKIRFAPYSGGGTAADYANPANWSAPIDILTSGTTVQADEVVAVGEPTIATREGRRILYFVYARVRATGDPTGLADLDFQAGYVEHR